MALPIILKKTIRDYSFTPGRSVLFQKDLRVQARPFNLVLPYYMSKCTGRYSPSSGDYFGGPDEASYIQLYGYSDDIVSQLAARACEKLKGKAYTKAAVGLNLIEGKQSIDLIASSAKTLLDVGRALKRGDIRSVQRLLKIRKDVKGVDNLKNFGNKFLAFHFGWAPLLGDIHDALEALTNPIIPHTKVSAKASAFGSDPIIGGSPLGTWMSSGYRSWETTVRCGLLIKGIRDPLTFTLEQYGLNNPLALAWESVPYSFVVDWFVNVGSYLDNLTAFSGLEIDGTYNTISHKTSSYGGNFRNPGHPEFPSYSNLQWTAEGFTMWRNVGLPNFNIEIKKFKPPSKERALTALSLLIQFMKSA